VQAVTEPAGEEARTGARGATAGGVNSLLNNHSSKFQLTVSNEFGETTPNRAHGGAAYEDHPLRWAQVRFRRDRFSPTGELGYNGIRGAVWLGYRFTCIAGLLSNFNILIVFCLIETKLLIGFLNPKPSCLEFKSVAGIGSGKT
jgi:hypothetical protein